MVFTSANVWLGLSGADKKQDLHENKLTVAHNSGGELDCCNGELSSISEFVWSFH